jgi:UDPglucose 6-dehydrogenase
MMRVCVIGVGYVGLVTGACLAEKGHRVVCVDIDDGKVARVNRGECPIVEAGLDELISRHVGKNLRATADLDAAVQDSDISFIAVGTPFKDGGIDLTFVEDAASAVGRTLGRMVDYHVVVVKSTVVPGTTAGIVLPILERESGRTAGRDFGVGMNPEFLTEGTAVDDFMHPDRIVLGGIDERSVKTMEELYREFDDTPVLTTNTQTAEMIKYASNALLATMISFSNEIAGLCSSIGEIDVSEVTHGVHLSRYLSPESRDGDRVRAPISSFIEAGCGFGGSCLPKDVNALIAHGRRAGRPMRLLQAVMDINASQPDELIALLRRNLGSIHGATVAVLGLAFKPDTDDVRESPAIPVVERLVEQGARVRVHDPVASEAAKDLFHDRNVSGYDDLAAALSDVDAVVLVTRWDHYLELPRLFADLDPQPLFVDGRRMLSKHDFDRYDGIGM